MRYDTSNFFVSVHKKCTSPQESPSSQSEEHSVPVGQETTSLHIPNGNNHIADATNQGDPKKLLIVFHDFIPVSPRFCQVNRGC